MALDKTETELSSSSCTPWHSCEMHFGSHTTQCNKKQSSHSFCHKEVIPSDQLNNSDYLQENGAEDYTSYREHRSKSETQSSLSRDMSIYGGRTLEVA